MCTDVFKSRIYRSGYQNGRIRCSANTVYRSFNIHIPELIYESDIILDYIIKHKFNTSVSKESIMLSEFWGFDEIQDDEERIFLLKEKLRKLINIKIKEESELVMMSIETEDRILSADIMI